MARQPVSPRLRFRVFQRDAFRCRYCGRGAPDVRLEVDHLVPVSKDGPTTFENLITSCLTCNRGKTDQQLGQRARIPRRVLAEIRAEVRTYYLDLEADPLALDLPPEESDAMILSMSEDFEDACERWLQRGVA